MTPSSRPLSLISRAMVRMGVAFSQARSVPGPRQFLPIGAGEPGQPHQKSAVFVTGEAHRRDG